jgi:type II secretory pathway predicted ATPase ExeA
MNRSPFPFRDFVRAKQNLVEALVESGETYAMLTGDTGTGKTALLRDLRGQLDRARHRVLYFSAAKKLGAAGLVKVTAEALRVRTSMCHSVSLDRLLRALTEESHTILLWLDLC